jgi:hypothetical protein
MNDFAVSLHRRLIVHTAGVRRRPTGRPSHRAARSITPEIAQLRLNFIACDDPACPGPPLALSYLWGTSYARTTYTHRLPEHPHNEVMRVICHYHVGREFPLLFAAQRHRGRQHAAVRDGLTYCRSTWLAAGSLLLGCVVVLASSSAVIWKIFNGGLRIRYQLYLCDGSRE